MAAVPQKVLHWLHAVLTSEYRNVNRTYSDVAQTLSSHPNISLRTDVYTFENGASSLLLNLRGNLPVSFRGTTYAFPISIWIPREYPSAAPMNFVTPAKDMAIRPGQYVSTEGRVYHPYLAGWRDDIQKFNLLGLFSIMQDIFSREPPLIARQEQIRKPTSAAQRDGMPPPVPPLPPELGESDPGQSRLRSSTGQQQPPPPPPKPFDARGLGGLQTSSPPHLPPHPQPSESPYGSSQQPYSNGHARIPQPMPQLGRDRTSSLQSGPPAHYRNQSQQSSLGPVSSLVPPAAPTQQRRFTPDRIHQEPEHKQPEPPSANQPPPAPPPSYANASHQPSYQLPVSTPTSQHLQHHPYGAQQLPRPPKPPQEDLLTSPFETPLPRQPTHLPAPPIPPNPQKDALLSTLSQTLTKQVQSTHANTLSAIPPLKAQQAALETTLAAINNEITHLDSLEALLTSNEQILHKAMRDADAVLEDAKKRQVPDADDVLVAPTVVARQLYEAVAEEKAIEDCRAVLAKALDKGRIGGGVWARQTRGLAREEFLKKALVKKISRGMGLGEGWE